jgi:hypothetical protein
MGVSSIESIVRSFFILIAADHTGWRDSVLPLFIQVARPHH